MGETLIGILAGMGPRATAPFVDMVVSQCQAQYGARRVSDFPHMMIYSLPAPIAHDRPLDHPVLRKAIGEGLKRLEATGADFIAMPCNTAHVYHEELAGCLGVPLLDMIAETVRSIPAGTRKVALFATRMTVEAGFYQRGIERAGLELALSEDWQARIDRLLTTLFAPGDLTAPQAQWDDLVRDVEAAGIDTILIGCTDLNVVSRQTSGSVRLLDATECLARAVVQTYLGLRVPSHAD